MRLENSAQMDSHHVIDTSLKKSSINQALEHCPVRQSVHVWPINSRLGSLQHGLSRIPDDIIDNLKQVNLEF